MDARVAPPPGSAEAGDLYTDLQTRTLWLGVDISVDSSGFVLISDIISLMAEDIDIRTDCMLYTDNQITARAAPLGHTHTASEITDFNQQVITVVTSTPGTHLATGQITMYSGPMANIGVGDLAGWALCDGNNGTPDLRDKFIIGAGNLAVGTTNPVDLANVSPGGDHVHTIDPHALTVAEMPYHAHTGITGTISHNHRHYVSGYTDAQGQHQHTITVPGSHISGDDKGWSKFTVGNSWQEGYIPAFWSDPGGNHQHTINFWTGYVDSNHYHGISPEGGNIGHTHDIVGGGGSHSHVITSAQLRDALPYLALAYIMKL